MVLVSKLLILVRNETNCALTICTPYMIGALSSCKNENYHLFNWDVCIHVLFNRRNNVTVLYIIQVLNVTKCSSMVQCSVLKQTVVYDIYQYFVYEGYHYIVRIWVLELYVLCSTSVVVICTTIYYYVRQYTIFI